MGLKVHRDGFELVNSLAWWSAVAFCEIDMVATPGVQLGPNLRGTCTGQVGWALAEPPVWLA